MLFASLIILQSCAVYQKAPVSLEQASKQDVRAKIKTKTNESFLVLKIIYEDDKYYGLQKVNGEKIRITLHADDINSIRLHDKTLSTVLSIGMPFGIVLEVIGVGLALQKPGHINIFRDLGMPSTVTNRYVLR